MPMRPPGKKAILAIQGGGAQAAFAAGVWRVLGRWLEDGGYELVGIGGASAGSWNAALIARHLGDRDLGGAALERFWHTIATPNVPFLPPVSEHLQRWNGLLTGLLFGNRHLFVPNAFGASTGTMPALYDSRPMLETLRTQIGDCPRAAGAPVLAAKVVDAGTGLARAFDNRHSPLTSEHLKASASIPLLFPATKIGDRLYWDGDFARRSVLGELIDAVKDELEPGGELLGIVIEPMPDHAAVPATTLGMSFALLGGLLSGKGEDECRLYDARKSHADFVRRAYALVADTTRSELSQLVGDEHRRLTRQGEQVASVLRIARAPGPHDYISRDFDFSPERITSLIAQGAAAAKVALTAREEQRPRPFAHA
jgi:NTE family protein